MRRLAPRIGVSAFCSELGNGAERHGLVVDVSDTGVRVERAFVAGQKPRVVQLEFELPGVDEIIWAKGEICFDQVKRALNPAHGGLGGLIRTSGIRILAAAQRDMRMLRDYIYEVRHSRDVDFEDDTVGWCLSSSAAFAHG